MSKYLTHTEAAEHCRTLTTLASRQIKAIATDKRFNDSHKREAIARIKADTNEKIAAVRTDTSAYSEETRAALALKSRYSATPSEAQIAQLTYVKQSLEARWKTMSASEMSADWQAAIQTKDAIVSRIYRDFSAPVWQQKHNGKADMQPIGFWQELADQTETLILPADVLTARQQLADLENQDRAFLIASREAMIELDNLVLAESGAGAVSETPLMTQIRIGF